METLPYDQYLARRLVRPLARIGATPNAVTTTTLVMALSAAGLFALGAPASHWGAALFALARFLDHADGELARLTGQTSRFGYYYDYAAGALSYAGLFLGIGIAESDRLGAWALVLSGIGAAAAFCSLFTSLGIDRARSPSSPPKAAGYPALGRFEIEDGIYLIVPLTWLGLLGYFFIAACVGAAVYCLWTVRGLVKARAEAIG